MPNKMNLQQFGASIKAKHPEYRDMDDTAVGKAVLAKYPQYGDMVEQSPAAPPPSLLQRGMNMAGDVLQGAGKGAMNTLSPVLGGITYGVQKGSQMLGVPPNLLGQVPESMGSATADIRKQAIPTNTPQRIGYGGEQAAEFLAPGGAEKVGAAKLASLAPRLGKAAAPLARMATSALSSGAVNAAQGGSPVTGAEMGAGGSLLGSALKAASPYVTEIAQGIHTPGAKAGKAILGETNGILPDSIRKSASGVLGELNPQLNAAADESTALIPMGPAREAASEQIGRAQTQNQPRLIKGVQRMGSQLMERDYEPGLGAEGPSATLPIPDEVPARDYLELRRGIGKALPAGSWSPESSNAFKAPRNAIYGTMTDQFHNAVPGTEELDNRISSLIPATKEPKNFFFGHALGPGVGATLGGVGGYRRGVGPEGTDILGGLKEGTLGALGGATAGFIYPAAMNSAARIGYGPATQRLLLPAATGAALQLTDRKDQQ